MIELSQVLDARRTIDGSVHRTPTFTSIQLGDRMGIRLHLKAELLQKTGSFKPRGALNRLRSTPEDDLERGLITISAGNHAQGLAWAAAQVGASATVVMPTDAPRSKVDATRDYGAEVVLHGTVPEAYQRMLELKEERGLTLVHPFDDPLVIAGQGTVGLEIAEQVPDVDLVVCPVGGGGLISGIALALKGEGAEVRVVGVEPEGADAMRRSWEAGEPIRLEQVDTVADGLAAPMAGELTYPMTRRWVDDLVTVTDQEIVRGMEAVLTFAKLYVEPAGAAAVAALLAEEVPVRQGETVVAILSGGNVDISRVAELLG